MPRNRFLICGCCGAWFRGHQDLEHDAGYGECTECKQLITAENERDWDKLRDKVAASLNINNRIKFLSYDKEIQRGLMLEMMEDGIINFVVKRN